MLKEKLNFRRPGEFYYFRDNSGIEVDLLVERQRHLHLFEIKSAMTPDASFGANMARLSKSTPDIASRTVIYAGAAWPLKGGGKFVNFKEIKHEVDWS